MTDSLADFSAPFVLVAFDIDGVLRDVSGSYRRALADTVERFTDGGYRPSSDDIDRLKAEGAWNNDWEGSQELVLRYFEAQGRDRAAVAIDYGELVDFFQSRYRGENPEEPGNWTGYIRTEPLLCDRAYFEALTQAGVGWGFFSGATRGSANYILQQRIGVSEPILVAMEDAPGKPDPTGLLATVQQLEARHGIAATERLPVVYVGDTVADIYAVAKAAEADGSRRWIGVGVLPPHVQTTAERQENHGRRLREAGAAIVLKNVCELTSERLRELVASR